MATFTPAELVAQLYIGFYDRAPDPTGLEYWVGRINAGVSMQDIGDSFAASPEAAETYPYFMAPSLLSLSDFLNNVYENVFGRAIDADGLDYYSGRINGGESVGSVVWSIIGNAATNDGSPDQAYLQNKVDAGLHWATDAASGDINIYQENGRLTDSADASAHGVIDLVTADPASVDAANDASDAFFSGEGAGEIRSFTAGVDNLVGTAGDDTFVAGTSNTGLLNGNDLGTTDTADGGAGHDALKIIDSTVVGAMINPLSISNIEQIDITNNALLPLLTTSVNFQNISGVEEINSVNSYGNVNAFNIQGPAELGVINTIIPAPPLPPIPSTATFNFAETAELGDTQQLNLDGANASVVISGASTSTLTTLDIDSSNNASEVDKLVAPVAQFETLNITGDAGFVLSNQSAALAMLTTVEAGEFTGDLALNLGNNDEDLTFNGGSGDTNLVVGAGDDTITTGDGDDSVVTFGGTDTIHTGGGMDFVDFGSSFDANDVADGGAGDDTIAMDSDNANLLNGNANVTNFETLHVTGDTTSGLSLNGYNLPTGLNNLIVDGDITHGGAGAAISNFAHGTITIEQDQDSGQFLLVGDAFQSDTIVIDATGDFNNTKNNIEFSNAHVGQLAGLDISFSTDADGEFESGGLTLTSLTFDGDIKSASFSGGEDNSVHIVATAGAGELTDTLDLSNFEGYFKMDAIAGINGNIHTILVGNLADDGKGVLSNINVQSGTVAGSAQTYVFGSELDHGITIEGFDGVTHSNGGGAAAGLNADVLDLSALGVTALSELTLTDNAGNLDITSATGAFDGTITLVGIVQADLTAADFHFA